MDNQLDVFVKNIQTLEHIFSNEDAKDVGFSSLKKSHKELSKLAPNVEFSRGSVSSSKVTYNCKIPSWGKIESHRHSNSLVVIDVISGNFYLDDVLVDGYIEVPRGKEHYCRAGAEGAELKITFKKC